MFCSTDLRQVRKGAVPSDTGLATGGRKGRAGASEAYSPARGGSPGESCLSAERLPEVSLISGTASETLSCEPGTRVLTF